MLKDYLVVAQEALSAQKEIYQVKQQRLELAQQEYQQLHAVWEHKLGSQVSCEYLPPPVPPPTWPQGRGNGHTDSCMYCFSMLLRSTCVLSSPLLAKTTTLFLLLLVLCYDSSAIFIPFPFIHFSSQNASWLTYLLIWSPLVAGRSRGSFWLMYRVSVWKDEDVLEVDGVDGCTTV